MTAIFCINWITQVRKIPLQFKKLCLIKVFNYFPVILVILKMYYLLLSVLEWRKQTHTPLLLLCNVNNNDNDLLGTYTGD